MTIRHESLFYKFDMITFHKVVDRERASIEADTMDSRLMAIFSIDNRKTTLAVSSGESHDDAIYSGIHFEIRISLVPIVFRSKQLLNSCRVFDCKAFFVETARGFAGALRRALQRGLSLGSLAAGPLARVRA